MQYPGNLVFWQSSVRTLSVGDAGMAADPLLHIVVKLQGTEELLCYMPADTLAVQVFKICKLKAKCLEDTLQHASGMDLVEDGRELSAGTYTFTPAESTGMSKIAHSVK